MKYSNEELYSGKTATKVWSKTIKKDSNDMDVFYDFQKQ